MALNKPRDGNGDELKRYPNWTSVPRGLASKSRLKRDFGMSASGLEPVARVYQAFDKKWIDLYSIRDARSKRPLSDCQ